MKTLLRNLLFIFLSLSSSISFSQAGMWTWISGSNIQGSIGVYGTQGIPSVNNFPPGLYEYAEWKDLQGNFWLYGGWDPTYSDLWKYNPVTNEWTWVKGNGQIAQAPVYGTMGIPNSANTPGQRPYCSVSWVDLIGNLWLFGGGDIPQNDLWRYNIATNEWTWMSGSNMPNALGVFGTLGVPSPLNVPGARHESCSSWTDSLNNLWMFAGLGANGDLLNDLWRYSIATNEWTWMSGSSIPNAVNVYGIKGVTNATNCPGARYIYSKWHDNEGCFWVFGGADFFGFYDDLWKFDPGINQWTWMAGTNTVNYPGIYQNMCTSDSINTPSCRIEHRSTVTDHCGRFWMFGGYGTIGFINDLWAYDPYMSEWMWVSGSNVPSLPNVYGTMGVPAPTNSPASRWGSISWWGNDNRFYLFGGNNNNVGPSFADLWVYTPDSSCIPPCGINPVAIFSAPNHVCPGSCINFNNNSVNATSYLWTFQGASTNFSTDENPQNICYNTPGNYDVTLISSNANGSDTITLLNYITVYPFPPPQGILQNGDTLFSNQGAVSYQWYFNNVLINGATDYYYVALQSGDYNVVCTDANGCEVEAVLNDVIAAVSPLSLGEGSGVRLVPNPTTGELEVQTGKIKIDYIDVLTVAGKSILKFETGSNVIDVSALADGYYFIEIKSNDKIYRSSFVKKSKQ